MLLMPSGLFYFPDCHINSCYSDVLPDWGLFPLLSWILSPFVEEFMFCVMAGEGKVFFWGPVLPS